MIVKMLQEKEQSKARLLGKTTILKEHIFLHNTTSLSNYFLIQKGLFRGAIAQSMTVLQPSAYISTEEGEKATKTIAALAGCQPALEILKCLRNVSPNIIDLLFHVQSLVNHFLL